MQDIEREQGTVYRRRRFAAPHRRRGLWARLFTPFVIALVVVGAPALAVLWVIEGAAFKVAECSISGSGRVSLGWAGDRLTALEGRHILGVGVDDVEALLTTHPWVRGVELRKRLPSELEVRILERRAVSLLRSSSGLFYLDPLGGVIAPYDALEGGGDYVIIDAEADETDVIREALAIADIWARCSGPWAPTLSEVDAISASTFRIYSSALDFPMLVTSDRLESGVEALRRLLPKISRRYPDLILADLRFQEQLVFQRAAGPPMEG